MTEEDYDKRLDSLKRDVNELRVLLKDVAEELKSHPAEGDECMRSLRENINRGIEWVKDRTDLMRSGGRRAMARMESRVERRPIASVLTALGVGILMGRVLMRR